MQPRRGTSAGVDAFVARARSLDDEDRLVLADARAAIDESFHASAWRAANEIVAERGQEYVEAWIRIGAAFLPDRLEALVRGAADPGEVARWQAVARLARVAMEDALLAFVAADLLRPPDLRELCGPWRTMLEAAHRRAGERLARQAGLSAIPKERT